MMSKYAVLGYFTRVTRCQRVEMEWKGVRLGDERKVGRGQSTESSMMVGVMVVIYILYKIYTETTTCWNASAIPFLALIL